MKRQKIFLFVNGILTFPGGSENWTGRAVTATHLFTQHKAEKVEYFTSALTRSIMQSRRADKLVRVLQFYVGWDKVIVAHSNGADVVMDALRKHATAIRHLHLVSPAITSDCAKNGLADLLKTRAIQTLTIYMAKKDKPLRMAKLWPAKWLGYGALGIEFPKGLTDNFIIHQEESFGHSTWWDDEHFQSTMELIWAKS